MNLYPGFLNMKKWVYDETLQMLIIFKKIKKNYLLIDKFYVCY